MPGNDTTVSSALLSLGANARGRWGMPADTLTRAMTCLENLPRTRLLAVSRLWRSAPYGGVPQPPFVNAAAWLKTALPPHELLARLQALERAAGRRRAIAWGPRALDIDLLDYDGMITRPAGMGRLGTPESRHRWQKRGLILPHPGIPLRPFVLLPLAEIAPRWKHPLLRATPATLLARLPGKLRAQCSPLAAIAQSGGANHASTGR